MIVDILTLFPEMFDCLNHSILKRAFEKNLLTVNVVDIRNFSKQNNKKCDDYIYGGGAGMLMMAQPIIDAYLSVKTDDSTMIYTSPKGETFNQKMAKQLSSEKHLIVLCGHYEGVDERVLEITNAKNISIGDYVLTGGELACMVMIDSIARNIEGVIKTDSVENDSFSNNLLEYPQYTRPEEFMGLKVPEVLLSGNHAKIDEYRKQQSLLITKKLRPDLLDK